jgi:hypothetical protein
MFKLYISPKRPTFCFTGGDSDASYHVNDRELMKDPDVIFSGYRMPHPLEHKLELRVQTAENCKPEAALMKAIENLIKESTFMEEKFRVCDTGIGQVRRLYGVSGVRHVVACV